MDRVGRRTTLPPERMTPMKIRGRRGQKARLRAQRKTKEAADAADMATSTIVETTAEVQHSKLESLPTEIIESIFLYSMNVELPRASLMLGRVLSSTGIKHRVLRAILLNPYLEGAFDDETSGNLQSTLLCCRWVDRAMFTHALHELWLAKLVALFQGPSLFPPVDVSDTTKHHTLLGPGCPIADTSTSSIAHFVKSFELQSGLLDSRRWDWVSYSDEKLTLTLCDYTCEVAELSLCEAIVQGNTALLEILLKEQLMPPHSPIIPLTQKHLRLAIFEGGCNTKTINLLLQKSMYLNSVNECPRDDVDLRLDDVDILEWATAKAEVGNDRGHWLLRLIKEWEKYGV
ncbi:MAG: hypothetical protein Q9176_004108 [Flavoplaca citrina]